MTRSRRSFMVVIAIMAIHIVFSFLPANAQELFATSVGNYSVLRYNGTTGAFVDAFVPPGSGGLVEPRHFSFGPDGNLYLAGSENNAILRYDGTTGAFLGTFASGGGLVSPGDVIFGPDGNLYVTSAGTHSILRYNGTTGAFIDEFVPSGSGGLSSPINIVFGLDHNLYVSSTGTSSILRYNGTTGAFIDEFVPSGSGGLFVSTDFAFGPDGNLYVCNVGTSSVLRFDGTTGASLGTFAASTGNNSPYGLAFGPDGNLYVSAAGTNRILRYNGTTGVFIDEFVPSGSGGLDRPTCVRFRYISTYSIRSLFDQTKAVKSSATIPIKIQVCDASGANLSSPTLTVHAAGVTKVSNAAPGTLQDAGNANPDFDFRYDATIGGTGGYIFNLKTTGYATGTYQMNFLIGSGTTIYSVQFCVR